MMLVWKLLKQHISLGQLTGFFVANLFGVLIILLGIQFYNDAAPLFSGEDSIFKKDFIIISKKVNTLLTLNNKAANFNNNEIDELEKQSFVKKVAQFTSSQFQVVGNVNVMQGNINMSTEMFFESIPDEYIDVKNDEWKYDAHSSFVPIIVPKNYLNLYNFGFAQSKQMPQISEGLVGLVTINIRIQNNYTGESKELKGRIVGFSNRINTILVPESFMKQTNKEFGNKKDVEPSRLIVEVKNPSDPAIVSYLKNNRYEVEGNDLESGKISYFLKLLITIVIIIGLFISVLSFFILVLSIYLLLQKNTQKLENLLMIGYSESSIARPYQRLTIFLNAFIFILAILILFIIRKLYTQLLASFFQDYEPGLMYQSILAGLIFFILISCFNCLIIKRKISKIR